ncbi:MAG: hydrogenase 4 subunit B [Candidatus Muproteobacteria bacterium RBG_16_60_9]|uniref:Hydrogenase 4 subunit B n=1 Tax=Candidatus Muproteobacteria bacterium RBG_16_60_9 TaxID=1817755 RepID=A0A1F6VJT8_9PROT|nr:MAG: hydrogenase 4 subunit B [Candidatus Muproteobacteria bacterium RBG_16_60_9]
MFPISVHIRTHFALVSALALAYVAVLATVLSGAASAAFNPKRRYARNISFALLGSAGVAATIAGGWTLLADVTVTDELPLGLPWLKWHVRLDALSGFFYILVGLVVLATSLYGPSYVREHERAPRPVTVLHLATGVFIGGMLLVLIADDALSFMIAWELMSVSSYLLVTFQHEHAANRRAGFLYLLMAHVGALAILLAFGVLAAFGGGFTFEQMRAAELTPLWATLAFAFALAGFGTKAGIVPLHAWLPEAHPAAPSHISALMSGVMLKVAIYGFIRFVWGLIAKVYWPWGLLLLVIGATTALTGVLYAMQQNDLKRLLAYSSIENVGIIFIGLGLSLIFLGTGHTLLGTLGLVAALYHTLNHALFKGLLFLGAGAVLYRTHERDLEHMGGLIRRMPGTAALFLVGCIAISALPPFNGFVSEWLTFQTALQAPVLEGGIESAILRSLIPLAAAVLALTGALAAACFVKAYGVAFLGRARTRHVARAREVPAGMLAGMGILAGACLLLGVFPTPVIEAMAPLTQLLVHEQLPLATSQGWLWLTPISPRVASYSAPFVVLAIALVFAIGYVALKRRAKPARRGPAWDCGFGALTTRMQYTSTAFSMPIRRVFAPAWKIEEHVEIVPAPGPIPRVKTIRHRLQVHDWSWLKGYLPIGRLVLAAARRIGAIQAGSIHTYLVYSFVTLLLFLWIIS